MTFIRHYAKKIFGPYMGQIPEERAWRYMGIARMLYFFSASTLGLLLWHQYRDEERNKLESGLPIIKDHSGGEYIKNIVIKLQYSITINPKILLYLKTRQLIRLLEKDHQIGEPYLFIPLVKVLPKRT